MKIAKLCAVMSVVGACSNEPGMRVSETTQHVGGTTTTIRVNGLSADALLNAAGDVNGLLTASRDDLTNTSALDFAYAFPHPTNPDIFVFIQGAGAIPNSGLTISSTSAHLAVTTSFEVTRCELNIVTSEQTCAATTAKTFDLTWTQDSFSSTFEKVNRITTFGPTTTRFHGSFALVSATVGGTWDAYSNPDMTGNLLDSQSKTVEREVTIEP